MCVEFRLDSLAAPLPLLAQRAGGGWEGVALDVVLSRCRTKSTPPQPARPSSAALGRSSARAPVARKRASSPPSPTAKGRERTANR